MYTSTAHVKHDPDRIVNEAMRLFSQHGYAAAGIAKIEAAAGLTPGAGGLYHHFDSKEAVLAAGIERQLARLGRAPRDPTVYSPRSETSKPS